MFRGDFDFPGFLTTWCGFHSGFFLKGTNQFIKFFVVGNPANAKPSIAGGCEQFTSNTANNNTGADSMANIYSHEIAETLTNSHDGWSFEDNTVCGPNCVASEMGDPCNWVFGTNANYNNIIGPQKKQFLLQQLWQRGENFYIQRNLSFSINEEHLTVNTFEVYSYTYHFYNRYHTTGI